MINKKRAIGGFLLSFVFLAFFTYAISGMQQFLVGSVSNSVQNTIPEKAIEEVVLPAPKPEIIAESALSIESNLTGSSKIIFEKSADIKLPIASLTKLMTAVIVLDNYKLSDKLTVNRLSDSQDAVKQDIKLGDTLPVESLLKIMLIASSNKSAHTLAEKIGVEKFVILMNQKAKSLGLENTSFADPTGLSAQNISTAKDLAKLTEHILKNYPKIGDISREQELDVPYFGKIVNTDQLLGEIPEIVCSKTGFTTQAKGCLLLAINNPKGDGYLINVILGADDRFSEMRKIINWSSETCK